MNSPVSDVFVVDSVKNTEYERYLYRCFAPMPFRRYKKRREYLKTAAERGLRKKILFFKGKAVGQIEYAPAEASGYPIFGERLVVMNCLWVLRKAKGNRFGRLLVDEMIKDNRNASGFSTIGLENHWSPWMKKEHMELFDFKSIDSLRVFHKMKRMSECFRIHLMWLPNKGGELPVWSKSRLLAGIDFCMAHPLYHPEGLKAGKVLQEC